MGTLETTIGWKWLALVCADLTAEGLCFPIASNAQSSWALLTLGNQGIVQGTHSTWKITEIKGEYRILRINSLFLNIAKLCPEDGNRFSSICKMCSWCWWCRHMLLLAAICIFSSLSPWQGLSVTTWISRANVQILPWIFSIKIKYLLHFVKKNYFESKQNFLINDFE